VTPCVGSSGSLLRHDAIQLRLHGGDPLRLHLQRTLIGEQRLVNRLNVRAADCIGTVEARSHGVWTWHGESNHTASRRSVSIQPNVEDRRTSHQQKRSRLGNAVSLVGGLAWRESSSRW
jgi:hypothetical protein